MAGEGKVAFLRVCSPEQTLFSAVEKNKTLTISKDHLTCYSLFSQWDSSASDLPYSVLHIVSFSSSIFEVVYSDGEKGGWFSFKKKSIRWQNKFKSGVSLEIWVKTH